MTSKTLTSDTDMPSLYVLNAAALSKPGAIQHLSADFQSYGVSVGVITETHFKNKHTDSIISVDGYTVYRRDRDGRRGGGVAVYVATTLQSTRWMPSVAGNHAALEIVWVRVSDHLFIAALYHPPRPIYPLEDLLEFIDACVAEISHDFPMADIVLDGDVNQLPDRDVVERTGLTQIVYQPTRGAIVLDRVYVSNPQVYSNVRVVTSVVRSDHKAVIVYPDRAPQLPKTRTQHTYRRHTPVQHAQFLQYAVDTDFNNPYPTASSNLATNTQADFDHFYNVAHNLLDQYYPARLVTQTSRDPSYISPHIKSMLRRKNKLMRAGRVEKAGALSVRIGQAIQRRCRAQLRQYNGKTDAGRMWAAVRQLTGRQQTTAGADGITAETLNEHYAAISTDPLYVAPTRKQMTAETITFPDYLSEWRVFRMLDNLQPTAAGLDGLPAWYLQVAAPIFCRTIANLFNMSLATSTVPHQWKEARIRPVPKVSAPKEHADYRPISVTPIMCRLMERTVVRTFLYPAFLNPPPALTFSDQFAFRPTGSTSAAIISLLRIVINLLQYNPFVVVVSLDFSKAFDTVRHSTLLCKLAALDLPTTVYNWLVDFFSSHSHHTVFNGEASQTRSITASIIQGSGVGPAAYTVTAGDLRPLNTDNTLIKFADDTYLVIPAAKVNTRTAEINNIEAWAAENNLRLNKAKSREVIFRDNKREKLKTLPPQLPDITRETSLKILGVTFTNNLSASDHVRRVVSDSAQTLYALRVLRYHGLSDVGVQEVFRAVVVSRLTYASTAWSGFVTAADIQRVDAFLRRSKRCGFCPPELPDFGEQLAECDDRLFSRIRHNQQHVLHSLLPPPSVASQNYDLRPRRHDRQLPARASHLMNCEFITRLLYKDIY